MRAVALRNLVCLALLVLPAKLAAQLPLMVAGFAGGAFNTDQNTPGEGGGGFSFQAEAGIRLRHLSFGGEFAQHSTGGDSKTRIYGAFIRFPSYLGESAIQIYLVTGLGAYQFDPGAGETRTTVGGSLGPGVSFPLGRTPFAFNVEARFHSTFDQLPRINNEQFLSATGGLELRF